MATDTATLSVASRLVYIVVQRSQRSAPSRCVTKSREKTRASSRESLHTQVSCFERYF